MIEAVTLERWKEAQAAERSLHTKSQADGIHHYRIAYGHNFRHLGLIMGGVAENVIEVGCADFPALRYMSPLINCFIVDPMPSVELVRFVNTHKGVNLISHPFESMKGTERLKDFEIWMFNVLQHVQDPEAFIALAKTAKTVRYFEPIDTGTAPYHPHSFSKMDFERWFPGVNNFYNEKGNECFHDGPCCYGVYKNG